MPTQGLWNNFVDWWFGAGAGKTSFYTNKFEYNVVEEENKRESIRVDTDKIKQAMAIK